MRKLNIVLVILWAICLIMDIVSWANGDSPNWLNMVLAHVCLIINSIDLSLRK